MDIINYITNVNKINKYYYYSLEAQLIPNISQALVWLKNHPHVLKGIQHGLERETLRVNSNGSLATTDHPKAFGSVLTHKWITTDFAEALLEFITPTDNDIDHMLMIMRDIHRYTARILKLKDEYMWPLSMPCYIQKDQEIELAKYGTSNIGRLKTLYREGLKNRYGALMQIISGIHYNFSLPMSFWHARCGKTDKNTISSGYLCLIRNYYRFGWIIPYLFGASPAICSSLLHGKFTALPFQQTNCGMLYLPYATSLRLSDLGYTSKLQQDHLVITFNKLHEYIAELKLAIRTPSIEYEKIGIEREGKRLQINSNILQIENELYAPIRPKRMTDGDEAPSDALLRRGIEYIEVRSLDINPFSPIGIDAKQVRFLVLFMIWCVLAEAPEISMDELLCIRANWKCVILEGRKPGLMLLNINCKTTKYPLIKIGKFLFRDLARVAETLDIVYGGDNYQQACNELVKYFDNPDLTLSSRSLRHMIYHGIRKTGISLALKYRDILQRESLSVIHENDFIMERDASLIRQRDIELSDRESFATFLAKHK